MWLVVIVLLVSVSCAGAVAPASVAVPSPATASPAATPSSTVSRTPEPTPSPLPTPVTYRLSGKIATTAGAPLKSFTLNAHPATRTFCADYLAAIRRGPPPDGVARTGQSELQSSSYSFRLPPGSYFVLLTVKDAGYRNHFWNGSQQPWQDDCGSPIDLYSDKVVDFIVPPGN